MIRALRYRGNKRISGGNLFSKLASINKELTGITRILKSNIVGMNNRGVKLATLETNVHKLSEGSKNFYKQAKALNPKPSYSSYWKYAIPLAAATGTYALYKKLRKRK